MVRDSFGHGKPDSSANGTLPNGTGTEHKNHTKGRKKLSAASPQPKLCGRDTPLPFKGFQRRGGCATKKMSRSLRSGADGGRSPRKPARSVSAIARNIKQ